jgi:3-hydroxymyristoyl/3-hydroxydecanoyl-(acyl carrier protein) dehydratase
MAAAATDAAATAIRLRRGGNVAVAEPLAAPRSDSAARQAATAVRPVAAPMFLDPAGCREFAVGSIARALGPEFAPIDLHPTRVRLPDAPLLLVDRVLSVEGEPLSMTSGRVVTEHDVLESAWYLDGGKAPVCIAVEAGQADLLLSGYLGIDLQTRGLAVYRLLDAAVTFFGELPRAGDTVRYDIRIEHFFPPRRHVAFPIPIRRHRERPRLPDHARWLRGLLHERRPRRGPWDSSATSGAGAFGLDGSPASLGARRSFPRVAERCAGRGAAPRQSCGAFGEAFAGLGLTHPRTLPGGRLRLVDRVEVLDPHGGRHGRGLIRAEMDVRPDDWFLVCHFSDDPVMPGTLMYECCLHTLRILLLRMGWVGEDGAVGCEPVPGIASQLRCRGQVTGSTRKVTYEVHVREVGYRPEPYAVADALMYADDKPIVEMLGMSLRFPGLERAGLEALWSPARTAKPRSAAIFGPESILAFAVGNPSEAFGERYRVFDAERRIARLPGPPYQLLDRIVRIRGCEQWKLAAGGEVDAEYDVPPDAWYFDANRSDEVPYCVLLETALQPCGWLAAYLGSALTSPDDLAFRNLGGHGVQLARIGRDCGTLTTTIRMTRVSRSGGMIIQNFDFEVRSRAGPVYRGDTYFGFFSREALITQVGLRDLQRFGPLGPPGASAGVELYPEEAPFPDERLRMLDRVLEWSPTGARPARARSVRRNLSARMSGFSAPTSIRTRCGPARSGSRPSSKRSRSWQRAAGRLSGRGRFRGTGDRRAARVGLSRTGDSHASRS